MKDEFYSDDYLLSMVHERSEDAQSILYEKYYKTVVYKAKKYQYSGSKLGLDLDDLIQEGLIGLSQAIEDYSTHKNVLFTTFANLCIEREIQSAILKSSRKKHSLLNESLSIDKEYEEGASFTNLLESKEKPAGEQVYENLVEKLEVSKIIKSLTKFEKDVFMLKYYGFDYQEIASILDKPSKSIDNALQRIKKKVKLLID